jgi:hypothetical protein
MAENLPMVSEDDQVGADGSRERVMGAGSGSLDWASKWAVLLGWIRFSLFLLFLFKIN